MNTDTFKALADLSIWTPHAKKRPHNGLSRLPWKVESNRMTLAKAVQLVEQYENNEILDNRLTGIGLVIIDSTVVDGYRLIAIDVDKLAVAPKDFSLVKQIPTYWEQSPSGTGLHAYAWVPESWAAQYQNTGSIQFRDCHHMEIYIGNEPTFITVTGWQQSDQPIAQLDETALALLVGLLTPVGSGKATPAPEISGDGTVIDLSAYSLSPVQRRLLDGAGQPELDRNKVVMGLLIKLIDEGAPQENILATLTKPGPLWQYCCDHREQDSTRALTFARDEINRAYGKSKTGMREALIGFNEGWGVPVALKPPVPLKPATGVTGSPLCESMSTFMADRKPQEVLIEGILYKGDHNAALGHPNAGKTTGILDLCLRMIFGLDLPGRQVVRCRILYLAGEDPAGIRRRIKLWCQTHGKNIEDLDDWLYIVRRPVLDDPEQVKILLAELDAIKPELMVVDTFSANYGGESEDKATEVKKWMTMIREDFVGRFDCCVVTLHHPPKGATDIHNWRGSGAAAGDIDNIFCFRNLGNNHIRMDQADGKAKHRTAEFEPLTWQTETATIDGWLNNLKKLETSVRATLVSGCKAEAAVLVCRAIQVLSENGGKPSHVAIAELADVAPGSMASMLGKMKTKGGLPNHPGKVLVVQKDDGSLRLTRSGKALADFAIVDTDMTKRIAALKGDDDNEEGDDDAE